MQCDNNGKDIWVCYLPQDDYERTVLNATHWHYYGYCPQLMRKSNAAVSLEVSVKSSPCFLVSTPICAAKAVVYVDENAKL